MATAQPDDIQSWPRVTEILRATGIADFSGIRNAEFYLQRGSDVHMVCESIDKGESDYWTGTDMEGYAAAWKKFCLETDWRSELIEHSVSHPQRQYRGTLDRVGRFGESAHRVLLDIKSGIVADWVRLQTAAYAACLEDPASIHRCGLQLKKTGDYAVSPAFKDYRQDSNYFFSLVSTIHGRTIYGKTEILPEEFES
jgi:hypothetical protein